MRDYRAEIDQFVGCFEQQIRELQALPAGPYMPQFRKSIYMSILDALARAAYPGKPNRWRFLSVVGSSSAWADQNRVSLPHLARLLTRLPDPEFSRLRAFVHAELATWVPGNIVKLNSDPPMDAVLGLWPSAGVYRQLNKAVSARSLQHVSLLYQYRNSLIHESRPPGHSHEPFGGTPEPHYIYQMADPRLHPKRTNMWLLHYPVAFFEQLVRTSIEHLKTYLIENNINPHDLQVEGDYWLDSLNE